MNKEFLTNQSNQLEEYLIVYLIDLVADVNDAVKKLSIAPEKKREDFAKAVSRS